MRKNKLLLPRKRETPIGGEYLRPPLPVADQCPHSTRRVEASTCSQCLGIEAMRVVPRFTLDAPGHAALGALRSRVMVRDRDDDDEIDIIEEDGEL